MCSEVLVVVIEGLLYANHSAPGAITLLRYAGDHGTWPQPAQSSGLTVSLKALGSVRNLATEKLCEGHHIEDNHEFQVQSVSIILENQIKSAHILRMQLDTMGH